MKLLRSRARSNRERGVTMLLIAFAMMSLLAMAVLAIDVTTLYVAQGEAQNAADAAALAGAKMFVTSQLTSITGGAPPITSGDVCVPGGPGSTAAANRVAEAAAAQNTISGQAAAVKTIACNFTQPGNPRITVTIERASLPTFFARIWRAASNTVTATATAEAFNASGLNTPVQVQSVKPFLVPNCTPRDLGGANTNCANAADVYYVNPADGTVNNTVPLIGQPIQLHRARQPGDITTNTTGKFDNSFYGLSIPVNTAPACPSNSGRCNYNTEPYNYGDSIACASSYKFTCGLTTVGGVGGGNVQVFDDSGNYGQITREATQCLIHADGDDSTALGQDLFSIGTVPTAITAGYNNPNPALAGASTPNISRSDSVVTVPLYDGRNMCPGGTCNLETVPVVGFLQIGITYSQNGSPVTLHAVILNVIGCAPGATGNPIVGTGLSPIPVRLIQN